MNSKFDKALLIAYLYDELDAQQRAEVEEYLQQHPEWQKELAELTATRKVLGAVEEQEVIAPPIFMDDEGKSKRVWLNSYIKTAFGIAASLLLLLVAARLLDTQIRYSGGELSIRFGQQADVPVENKSITAEEVQALINASLTRNNEQTATQWDESQKRLESMLAKNLQENNRKLDVALQAVSQASQDQLRVFVAGLQSENLKSMQQFMQLSTAEQKTYVEGLLVDFSKYLQEQRNQDLQFFQTRVNNLERNTDQFKQETEQILAGIIFTTNKTGTTSY